MKAKLSKELKYTIAHKFYVMWGFTWLTRI